MMDVRDSYFQSDPFALMPPPTQSSFYAFNGVESINIGQCGWNGGWVRDCFGDGILNDVSNQKIICSGISIGSMDAVFQYLTLMDDVIMAKHTSAISQAARFPQCERNGVDQVYIYEHIYICINVHVYYYIYVYKFNLMIYCIILISHIIHHYTTIISYNITYNHIISYNIISHNHI